MMLASCGVFYFFKFFVFKFFFILCNVMFDLNFSFNFMLSLKFSFNLM